MRNPSHTTGFGDAAAPATEAPRRSPRAAEFGDAAATTPLRSTPAPLSASALTPVEILDKPRPAYTEEARRLGIEGEVQLDVVFGASGAVSVRRVVHGLGHGLDETAIAAARCIRFPARGSRRNTGRLFRRGTHRLSTCQLRNPAKETPDETTPLLSSPLLTGIGTEPQFDACVRPLRLPAASTACSTGSSSRSTPSSKRMQVRAPMIETYVQETSGSGRDASFASRQRSLLPWTLSSGRDRGATKN